MNTQVMHIDAVNLGADNYGVYRIEENLTFNDILIIRGNVYPAQIVLQAGSSIMPVVDIAVITIPDTQENRVQIHGIGFDSGNAVVRKTILLRSGAAIKQDYPAITDLADDLLYRVVG